MGRARERGSFDVAVSAVAAWAVLHRVAPMAPDAVLHVRYLPDNRRPWVGVAPWRRSPELAALAARVESALLDETRIPSKAFITQPMGTPKDQTDNLRTDIQNRRYSIAFPPTTKAGYGSGASSAPVNDWKPSRVMPAPDPGLVQLCRDIPASVGLLFGIPVVLTSGGGSETQTREAFRRFVASTIQPIALLTSEALSVALSGDVALDLRALRAYDTQGQARSVGQLVKAGVDLDDALQTVGLVEG